ncbi:MAG TPA: hypothetical protein VGD88_17190 [Opitutaceae bacterium]
MSRADEVLKRQVAMSDWSGTVRIAEGMLVMAVIVLLVSGLSALHEGESLLRAIVGPTGLILLNLRLRSTARCRELEQTLA